MSITVIAVAALMSIGLVTQSASLIGSYRRFTPLDSTATDVPNLQNASLATVKVFKKGSVTYVDWGVTSQPPGYVLGTTSIAKTDGKGVLTFTFEDAWSNKGKGVFRKNLKAYTLTLDLIKEGDGGADVRSLYDEWEVDKAK